MSLVEIPQKTILVVDDDSLVLGLVTVILKHQGYNVLQATGPREALQLVEETKDPIDLVLSDILMPGLSGPQLVAKILENRPEIRVLFMSGYAEDPILLLDHGWKFIQKPFVQRVLLEVIDQVFRSPPRSSPLDHFDTRP